MLKYALDTNLCVRVLRDRPQGLRKRFNDEAKSARPVENRQAVEAFAERLEVLDFDGDAAAHAGEIRAELDRKGRPIGSYDLLIAGHARSRGLIVVTGNLDEFERVDGLRCEDWEAPNP
jgi:tRNA(fMet)-specific endonuclease VapC